MHFHFPFSALSVLWTLTFAAHLVLLVVLMGRDRVRQFPWFTANIVLVAFRLLTSRLLFGRLPQATMAEVFLIMAAVGGFLSLMVVLEVARRGFWTVRRWKWLLGALVLMGIGAAVLRYWGAWPDLKTLTSAPPMQLVQLLAQKGMLLADVENIAQGLLIALVGRSVGKGFRSKVQQLAIGLMTASLAQLSIQLIWELIAKTAVAHSREEYDHILGIRDRLFNTNNVVFIAVLVWWIVCLWIDEPKVLVEEEPVPEPTSGSILKIPLPVPEPAAEKTAVAEDSSVHGRELPQGPGES
jgi:hypothetical protein